MHRALEVVELVENICAHLGPADPVKLKSDAARDLALLARASTIFLDPALDVLWKSQDSLVHLLRCMPHDLLVIPEVIPRRHMRPIAPPIVRISPVFFNFFYQLKSPIAPPASHSSGRLGAPSLLHAPREVFRHGRSCPHLRST
jgi:hypothetical protein